METFEECSINNSSIYTKPNILEENDVLVSDSGDCHRANGVDVVNSENGVQRIDDTIVMESDKVEKEVCKVETNDDAEAKPHVEALPEPDGLESISECLNITEDALLVTNTPNPNEDVICEVVTEVTIDGVESHSANVICEEIISESQAEEETAKETLEVSQNDVQFQTEILVEKNDNDVNENIVIEGSKLEAENVILSELDHNIELSEVLQSDIADNNYTNSGSIRHEVFNKEELLDILEGNDSDQATTDEVNLDEKKQLEAQIAMKQLSRLSKIRSTPQRKLKVEKKTNSIKKVSSSEVNSNKKQERDTIKQLTTEKDETVPQKQETSLAKQLTAEKENNESQKENKDSEKQIVIEKDRVESQKPLESDKIPEPENIVSSLVMDWDDDEPIETKECDNSEVSKNSEISTEIVTEVGEDIKSEVTQDQPTEEATTKEDTSQNVDKSGDDEPPRRIGRVIKKKVIFDPDNPDTFTKGKTPMKNKDVAEPTPPKKLKPEPVRQRSKSPTSKLQWKKPSPKNSKQCKRLSEVDKLLMDEGAVNMLYQLTPDAPKGKKNMRTKAEIIKKLQSSTPETKEMKFRERKKEVLKYEDGEAKRIIGGKQRVSLSTSVKSPSVSEDFETHSADDSIIYRRHSSSSYSSSCMSPRRLSDVETGSVQNSSQKVKENSEVDLEETVQQVSESFMAESQAILSNKEIDCLSIKEKLNSKLSQALNKRKRDNTKNDKSVKQKKLSKDDIPNISSDQFKFVSIVIENRLATVCVKKTAVKIGIEVIKELEEALLYLDKLKDTSVTLLSSECGVLCSSLDLNFLLEENKEMRVKQAYTLADSIRLLLCSAAQHSKLLCCSVWGACCGVGLALATLCDIVLASECATFALAMGSAPLFPGTAALTVRCQSLPQALINDLVIFGRRISSTEALQSGLISRTLWPDRFQEQVANIVKDIATQPAPTILLKKKLLNLRNSEEEARLVSCLEAERDLLVQYWTSVEGQELLRATLDCA